MRWNSVRHVITKFHKVYACQLQNLMIYNSSLGFVFPLHKRSLLSNFLLKAVRVNIFKNLPRISFKYFHTTKPNNKSKLSASTEPCIMIYWRDDNTCWRAPNPKKRRSTDMQLSTAVYLEVQPHKHARLSLMKPNSIQIFIISYNSVSS